MRPLGIVRCERASAAERPRWAGAEQGGILTGAVGRNGGPDHGAALEPLSQRIRRLLRLRKPGDGLPCPGALTAKRFLPSSHTPTGERSIHRKGPAAPLFHGSGLRAGMARSAGSRQR